MGRNEIRLRRHRMTARGTERFRNYNSVLKRHEENRRIKKIMRVFGFFVVMLVVIMIIVFLSRWEDRAQSKNTENNSTKVETNDPIPFYSNQDSPSSDPLYHTS